jgi:PPOX class probable F420-dependent enzyme
MNLSEEQRSFLDRHRVARLATADRQGAPHVVPLCYARIDDRLYFVCDDKPKRNGPAKLKRLANIADNPRVALVVDDYDDDWTQLAFLLLHLDATIVTDGIEFAKALTQLKRRYAPYQRMNLDIKTHPMVRMIPTRTHFWRADSGAP